MVSFEDVRAFKGRTAIMRRVAVITCAVIAIGVGLRSDKPIRACIAMSPRVVMCGRETSSEWKRSTAHSWARQCPGASGAFSRKPENIRF